MTETVHKIPKDRQAQFELVKRANANRQAEIGARIERAKADLERDLQQLFLDCGHSLEGVGTWSTDLDAGEFRIVRPDPPKGEEEQAKAATRAKSTAKKKATKKKASRKRGAK